MQPNFKNLRPRQTQAIVDKDASISYELTTNGVSQFFDDAARSKLGKTDQPIYVLKTEGYDTVDTISGVTGGSKGGMMWTNPDTTSTNRARLIYAIGNIVYLYDVTNDTRYLLRDINTVDSLTIAFLSGIQMKQNGYFVIGDSTSTTTAYKYSGTTSGVLASTADYSGTVAGTVLATDVAHGLQTGNTITFAGTTSYNETLVVTVVDEDTFYFTHSWDGNESGTWTGQTLEKVTMTGMGAGRLIGKLDDRLMVSGMGTSGASVQYSYLSTSGAFTNFTSSTDTDKGGLLSGSLDAITALSFTKGYGVSFEKDRATFHFIRTLDDSAVGRIKDTITIENKITINGLGVASAKAADVYDDRLFFATQSNGVYAYDPTSTGSNRLKNLMKSFRWNVNEFTYTNSSVKFNPKNNWLHVSCTETSTGVGKILIYNFDTKDWSVDNKQADQLFWDKTGQQMYGITSSGSDVIKILNGSYGSDGGDIELQAETRTHDMGIRTINKRFVNMSLPLLAVNATQSFLVEVFLDQNPSPTVSKTIAVGDIASSGGATAAWSGMAWNSGVPALANTLRLFYVAIIDEFIPDFIRMSIRVTEESSLASGFGQPVIRYSTTKDYPVV